MDVVVRQQTTRSFCDNTFTATIIDTALGDVQSYIVNDTLAENTTYYWRVMDNVLQKVICRTLHSLLLKFSGSVTLNSPANNSYNNPISSFLWNASTNTDSYAPYISDDSLFTNIIDSQTGLVVTNAHL